MALAKHKIIAEQMGIGTLTVEAHRPHIKEKLGLTDGAKLVRYAVQCVETSGRKASVCTGWSRLSYHAS